MPVCHRKRGRTPLRPPPPFEPTGNCMHRILLVKTTSLGDVIHCLPAVSDIAALYP